MNRISLILALGLAAVSGSVSEAADWNNGARGIKDHGGMAGVPVPAPVPVMESFSWYIRADLSIGMLDGGKFSETGLLFGTTNGDPATTPIRTSSSWYDNDYGNFFGGSVGMGRYFTPRVRGDITYDVRKKVDQHGNGTYSFNEFVGGVATGNVVSGTLVERTNLQDHTFLANGYWDLRERGRFTPYIGVGVGFAVRSFERVATHTEMINGAVSVLSEARAKKHELAPAAAATVGTGIALSEGRVLDFSYRYTYLGEVGNAMNLSGQQSVFKIGDTHEHALRAGLRWNIW